jgi:hypothetical protein
MKIKLRDVEPNPFRDMDHYPIDRVKVEAAKASIQGTKFWNNIVGRRAGKKVQIAYGHHRLVALRELFKPDHEIDVVVGDLTDDDMLRMMANENLEEWVCSARVIEETVRAVVVAFAKDKIKLKPPKGGGHKQEVNSKVRCAPRFSVLDKDGRKTEDVFRLYTPETVADYLGPGWWESDGSGGRRAARRIRFALDALEAKELNLISREAEEELGGLRDVTQTARQTIVENGRKAYKASKRKGNTEREARKTAREVTGRLVELAGKEELTPVRGRFVLNDVLHEESEREIPRTLPRIDTVAVWMMRKLNTYLSDRDSDYAKAVELFEFAGHIKPEHKEDLERCIGRLEGVLRSFKSALKTPAERKEVRAINPELLEAR